MQTAMIGQVVPIPYIKPPTAAEAASPGEQDTGFRERLEALIKCEEATQERAMAEAQAIERRVLMLKALVPFVDDPSISLTLRALLPAPPPPALLPVPSTYARAVAHPDSITDRIQVTRQLVLVATQTFDTEFTVNDVVARMTQGRMVDQQEHVRVRTAVAQIMVSLLERGEITKEVQGIGRKQTLWAKVPIRPYQHPTEGDQDDRRPDL